MVENVYFANTPAYEYLNNLQMAQDQQTYHLDQSVFEQLIDSDFQENISKKTIEDIQDIENNITAEDDKQKECLINKHREIYSVWISNIFGIDVYVMNIANKFDYKLIRNISLYIVVFITGLFFSPQTLILVLIILYYINTKPQNLEKLLNQQNNNIVYHLNKIRRQILKLQNSSQERSNALVENFRTAIQKYLNVLEIKDQFEVSCHGVIIMIIKIKHHRTQIISAMYNKLIQSQFPIMYSYQIFNIIKQQNNTIDKICYITTTAFSHCIVQSAQQQKTSVTNQYFYRILVKYMQQTSHPAILNMILMQLNCKSKNKTQKQKQKENKTIQQQQIEIYPTQKVVQISRYINLQGQTQIFQVPNKHEVSQKLNKIVEKMHQNKKIPIIKKQIPIVKNQQQQTFMKKFDTRPSIFTFLPKKKNDNNMIVYQ